MSLNMTSSDDISQLAREIRNGMFQELLSGQVSAEDAERWAAAVLDSECQHLQALPDTQTTCSAERPESLPKVPPSPWRSLGGYLDYSSWKDRDRFLELDRAIARSRGMEDAEHETNLAIHVRFSKG